MTARVLVTGADGFLGRQVVARWVEAGAERELRALVRGGPAALASAPGVEIAGGDLTDPDSLRGAVSGIETILHCASKNIDRDGSGFDAVNVEGTRALVAAARAAGVRRMLYVSTVGVYGHGVHRDCNEDQPLAPDTPFSRSKAAAEKILFAAHDAGELEISVLRHRFVYGDGDEHFVPRILGAARRFPYWLGGGRARLSLVLATDLADVVWRLATERWPGGVARPVFHVTSGESPSYRELVTLLGRILGCPVPRRSIPFALLYWPVRCRELLLGIDPETTASSISSLRLKLVGLDNTFSNARLVAHLGDFEPAPLAQGLEESRPFYERFV